MRLAEATASAEHCAAEHCDAKHQTVQVGWCWWKALSGKLHFYPDFIDLKI